MRIAAHLYRSTLTFKYCMWIFSVQGEKVCSSLRTCLIRLFGVLGSDLPLGEVFQNAQ